MKKNSIGLNVYGGITFGCLIAANLSQLLWTVWLTLEQIETGWGYSTNIEMFTLFVWMTQIFAFPAFILGAVYLLINIWRRSARWMFITNIILLSSLAVQYILINLFIFN